VPDSQRHDVIGGRSPQLSSKVPDILFLPPHPGASPAGTALYLACSLLEIRVDTDDARADRWSSSTAPFVSWTQLANHHSSDQPTQAIDWKRRNPMSMEYMHSLANRHGGLCLSKSYVNSYTHLEWRCAQGHTWRAKPNNVQQGKWCRICRQTEASEKQLRPISVLRAYAESRGGLLLTETYTRSTEKLRWRCSEGHQWAATAGSVFGQNSWCKTCANEQLRKQKLRVTGLEDLQDLAAERGGQILTSQYLGGNRRHQWTCHHKHVWSARPNDIRRGGWCPQCSQGLGERITR
jgi:hypothetical protein